MAENRRLLISCEHGGNGVPPEFRELFRGREALLETHRGYDIGILPLARRLARDLSAPLECSEVTRLLVDLNRSPNSPTLFSEISRSLDREARDGLLRSYYYPYRQAVERRVLELMAGEGKVVHLSVHSFTPVFRGVLRSADLGLLYDPSRSLEAAFCRRWQKGLAGLDPGIRVRRNYPYRGVSDSLVTHLRRLLPEENYLGIELEVNQRHPVVGGAVWEFLQQRVLQSMEAMLKCT